MATIKDLARYCKVTDCECCGIRINEELTCINNIRKESAIIDVMIDKWCKEHPEKTYKDDFFSKFPKACKNSAGNPEDVCVNQIYGTHYDCIGLLCEECWNRAYEDEVEKN